MIKGFGLLPDILVNIIENPVINMAGMNVSSEKCVQTYAVNLVAFLA